MKCKILKTEINPFMTFGKMPIANGFLTKENFDSEFFFNLDVGFSEKISLFQLNDHPTPEQMFNKNYPFYTGSSQFMKSHFASYADSVKKYLKTDSKLIEIGSNDGTFLKNFTNSNITSIGFEPSENTALEAKKKGVKTINSFFSQKNISELKDFLDSTDLICGANVICHIPDLTDTIKAVDKLLSKKGVFIFEEPYLGSMFKKTSYDQIYDEHIFIFSATSIQKIFDIFDFELIDLIPQITHGGSMRYVLARKKQRDINSIVKKILNDEKKMNLDNLQSCMNFKKNCEISKNNLKEKIKHLKSKGKKICGYAATSKSTTVLNYCKIGSESIEFICDTTKEKIGKYSPGMHIPIVSMDHFYKKKPDVAFLFAWNHKEEIFNKEKNFTQNKGEWISHVKF